VIAKPGIKVIAKPGIKVIAKPDIKVIAKPGKSPAKIGLEQLFVCIKYSGPNPGHWRARQGASHQWPRFRPLVLCFHTDN